MIYYQSCRHVRKRKVPSNAIQKGDKRSNNQNVISIWPLATLLSSKIPNVSELRGFLSEKYKIESTVREGKYKSLHKTYSCS